LASSDRFQVRSVRVTGATLLSPAEIEQAAAVTGANVFWIDRGQVEQRVRTLPVVVQVDVTPELPDRVSVHVVERQPSAYWISGDQPYVVDSQGVILKPVSGEDPADLPSVVQPRGPALRPGDRVDPTVLSATARLRTLLPASGIQPLAFEWSTEDGLEVPTSEGWRARFDPRAGDIDHQIEALKAVHGYLGRNKLPAELIDVRFGDRPYYR
jgi:cell division septal protein FtsQ